MTNTSTAARVFETGTVTQVIPPAKHHKYGLSADIRDLAAGELVITFDAREDHGGLRDYLHDLREWLKDPTTTGEGVYHAMAADGSLAEGDEVTLHLEHTDTHDFWRVVGIERGEADD